MRVICFSLIATLLLSIVGGAPSAVAEDVIDIAGDNNAIRGSFERSTSTGGAARSGGSSGPGSGSSASSCAGGDSSGPAITRNNREIVYDYTDAGGGTVRYVFDKDRDYCRVNGAEALCYGPRPDPERGGDRDAPAPAPPPLSPEEVVERTIVNVRLPRPKPNVDPGYAVTGMRAYLETGNDTRHEFDPIDTVLGPLHITATSTYTVNWGDGTTTGPHTTNGGKYPDGTITHVYQHSRTVDITVTQNWTASWRLAGESGTIDGLRSSGQLPNFAVRQVQAVRER